MWRRALYARKGSAAVVATRAVNHERALVFLGEQSGTERKGRRRDLQQLLLLVLLRDEKTIPVKLHCRLRYAFVAIILQSHLLLSVGIIYVLSRCSVAGWTSALLMPSMTYTSVWEQYLRFLVVLQPGVLHLHGTSPVI